MWSHRLTEAMNLRVINDEIVEKLAQQHRSRTTGRVNLFESDLSVADKCAARRQYRTLRLAMYAPQSSEYAVNGMYQGCYGHDRDGAREIIRNYYTTLSWLTYLGSK
jgi:hypothetical protein